MARSTGKPTRPLHPRRHPPARNPLSRANRVIIQTISYFLLFPCPYREPSTAGLASSRGMIDVSLPRDREIDFLPLTRTFSSCRSLRELVRGFVMNPG